MEVGQINRNSSNLYIFLYYFIHDIILIIFRIIKTKSTNLTLQWITFKTTECLTQSICRYIQHDIIRKRDYLNSPRFKALKVN